MATQSNNASKLNSIVRFIGVELRARNYRRSKRLFNRLQPDGIVHVIDFRMGQNWSIFWGKFTVELGVFIPEVHSTLFEQAAPKFITSPYCEEREGLGILGSSGKDIWWDLADNERKIGHEILDLLLTNGEQYLSRYCSRDKLLLQWEQERQQRVLSGRKILIMAIILSYRGNKSRAEQLLNEEFGNQYKSAFLEYARNVVTPLGLSFPMLK